VHATDELEQLQLERLQSTMNRVHKNVTHYQKKFNELGVIPEDMQSLSDLMRLPFTTKEDLRLKLSLWNVRCAAQEVVRIHSSSGTTSKPLWSLY